MPFIVLHLFLLRSYYILMALAMAKIAMEKLSRRTSLQ